MPPKRTVEPDVQSLKKLRKNRYGAPPSVEEASTNLSAPEFAPEAPQLQLVTTSTSSDEPDAATEEVSASATRKPRKAIQPAKVRALVVGLRDRQADEKTADERLRPRAHSVPLSLHIPARLDTRLREFAMSHKLRLGEVIEIAMDALDQQVR